MASSFNMENFLSNLISLASQPFDPQVLPAFLEQVTNHRWERVGGQREEDTSETPIGQQNIEHNIAARAQVEEGRSAALPNANETSVDQRQKAHPHPAALGSPGPITVTATAAPSTATATSICPAEVRKDYDDDDNNDDDDNDDDDDDNDTVFKSCCASDDANSNHLHDHADIHRFPNGQLCYEVNDPNFEFSTSWSMLMFSAKNGKGKNNDQRFYYHSCLGIYECPVKDCKVVSNPVHPKKKRRGALPTKATGSGVCRIHQKDLVHVACDARMTIRRSKLKSSNNSNTTVVEHHGYHNHQRPHEKPSIASKEWLREVVTVNKEALPNQIGSGTETRPPAGDIHPSFQNQDRLSYHMKKIENTVPKFELEDLPKFEQMMGGSYEFLKRASLDAKDGTISIQFPAMLEVTKKNGGTIDPEEGEVSTHGACSPCHRHISQCCINTNLLTFLTIL